MTDLLLIPGAGGDARYWRLVTPLLEARGYRVAAIELPYDDDRAGLYEFAELVIAAARPGESTVLVAQSMGAFVAPIVAERIAIERIVLVAPMIPQPGETPGEWFANTHQEAAARELAIHEGRDPDAEYDVVEVFLHDVPADVQRELLEAGEKPMANAAFKTRWQASAWPRVPTDVLVARLDRMFPLDFARRVARDRLGIEPDVIDSGHLPALARPDELAARIDAYVRGAR